MHGAVYLDRQSCRGAIKVDYIPCNDVLTSELEATERSSAQLLPQDLLGLRQVAAQPTRQPSYRFRCFTPLPGTRGAAPSLAHAHLSADSSCRLRTEEALAHVRPVLCRKRIALPSRNAPRPLFPSTHRVGKAGWGNNVGGWGTNNGKQGGSSRIFGTKHHDRSRRGSFYPIFVPKPAPSAVPFPNPCFLMPCPAINSTAHHRLSRSSEERRNRTRSRFSEIP